MAYRISQPLANTQFDDDKPKKKKTTTKTKTRTLRGMSVRQADKARSGSIDRAKTTTKTTVEKAAKSKSSKLDKKIERAKKRGVSSEYIKTKFKAKEEFKARKKLKQENDKSARKDNTPKAKTSFKATKVKFKKSKPSLGDRLKNVKVNITDACKGKQKGTHKCKGGKRALK